MAAPRITNEQIRQFLTEAHKHGLARVQVGGGQQRKGATSLGDIARAMKITKATLSEYLYQHCRRLRWNPYKPETWKDNADTDTPLHQRERQRYADQIKRMGDELRKAYRDANADDDLRQAVFGLAKAPVKPPVIGLRKPRKGAVPPIPLLFGSDYQWGEKISAAQMDGVNEFNLQVARERFETLITKTVEICKNHVGTPHAKTIVYCRGGDMVSGDIHQELRETNQAMSVGQVVDLVEHEAAGIAALRQAFDEVVVISVPGNHGRTTVKPMSKGYAETNYDTLSAWMLEREFKDDPGVKFYTPTSGDAVFEIYGWTFCMTHGDRIGSRGGMGFIGPAATIARGMKKNFDYWAQLGVKLDYQLVGHFHTSLELELGFANGSLPGISEYARDFRARPSRASQWLLFVHPSTGVTSRWPIYLSGPVKSAGGTQAFQFLKAA